MVYAKNASRFFFILGPCSYPSNPLSSHATCLCYSILFSCYFCRLLFPRMSASQSWNALSRAEVNSELAQIGLYYNRPEPAIICTLCQYALQPASDAVSKHLGERHKISKKARRGLKSFIKSLHLPDPNRLSNRDDYSTPHPHLLIKQGAACKQCDFRSTSLLVVQRHRSKEHGYQSDGKNWLAEGI